MFFLRTGKEETPVVVRDKKAGSFDWIAHSLHTCARLETQPVPLPSAATERTTRETSNREREYLVMSEAVDYPCSTPLLSCISLSCACTPLVRWSFVARSLHDRVPGGQPSCSRLAGAGLRLPGAPHFQRRGVGRRRGNDAARRPPAPLPAGAGRNRGSGKNRVLLLGVLKRKARRASHGLLSCFVLARYLRRCMKRLWVGSVRAHPGGVTLRRPRWFRFEFGWTF